MSNFIIQGYANLENVNANNMNLFYATMSEQLSAFFPNLGGTKGSICSGIGTIVGKFGQTGTGNVFSFENGYIRFLDQPTNLTTDTSIKPCYAYLSGSAVSITCPISATQYYVVAILSFNAPTDPFTTSTSVVISPTAMTLAQIAAQTFPNRYNPLFAITTVDAVNYTISLDPSCAFNYGYIIGNPFPDITDFAGLVSIIGAGGLSVTNHIECATLTTLGNAGIQGNLICAQSAEFFNNGLGPFVIVSRATSTLPNTYNLGLYSEVPDASIFGETHVALLQANGGATDPALAAGYNTNRWHMLNCAPGDLNPATYPNALAILGDIEVTQSFSVLDTGANVWDLICTTTGKFPSITTVHIGGYSNGYVYPNGVQNNTIDLVLNGIVTYGVTIGTGGVTSTVQLVPPNLSDLDVFTVVPNDVVIITSATANGSTDLRFSVTYR